MDRGRKGAESEEREPPTKNSLPEFSLNFAKKALQLEDKRAQKEVETSFSYFLTPTLTQESFVGTR